MIKLMVDSASDLHGRDDIFDIFVPITVCIGGKEFADGIDIDSDTFYKMLLSSKEFPHTSQPSPQVFEEIFQQIKKDGDEVIYFALSSELSGTYQGAVIAKEMVDYDKIHIIDTKTATHMIGVLAKYAFDLREKGCSAHEIVRSCEAIKSKIIVYAGLDTLEYLRRGGRLSNASAAVGTLARIKPIITVTQDGRVEAIGKALGKGKAIQYIINKIRKCRLNADFPLYSLYTYGEENVAELENGLSAEGYNVAARYQIGSTIGTHIGPNVYGIIAVID